MNSNILDYLLESGSCLAAFYFLYLVALKEEPSFQYNRFYLLAALLLSFLLPLFKLPLLPNQTYQAIEAFRPITSQLEPIVVYTSASSTVDSSSSIGWPQISWMVYVLGVCFFTFRFLRQLFAIYQFISHHKNKVVRWNGVKLIHTNGKFATFSFLNYIFWDNSQQLTQAEQEQVLLHESVHVMQGHSYDRLYLEMLQIVFWFNPLLLLFKKALLSTHEFIADAQVLQTTDKREYTRLLAKQVCLKMEFSIGTYFNKSLTLKRMKMIQTSKHSTPLFKKIMALPMLAGLLFVFSSNTLPVTELTANSAENTKFPVAAIRAKTIANQSFTLEELIKLFTYNKEKVGEYLGAKGWNSKEVVKYKSFPVGKGWNIFPWTNGNNLLSLTERDGERMRVIYQTSEAETKAIQAQAIELKMTNPNTGMDAEGTKYIVYVGAKYGLRIATRLDGTYTVMVLKKEDLRYI